MHPEVSYRLCQKLALMVVAQVEKPDQKSPGASPKPFPGAAKLWLKLLLAAYGQGWHTNHNVRHRAQHTALKAVCDPCHSEDDQNREALEEILEAQKHRHQLVKAAVSIAV